MRLLGVLVALALGVGVDRMLLLLALLVVVQLGLGVESWDAPRTVLVLATQQRGLHLLPFIPGGGRSPLRLLHLLHLLQQQQPAAGRRGWRWRVGWWWRPGRRVAWRGWGRGRRMWMALGGPAGHRARGGKWVAGWRVWVGGCVCGGSVEGQAGWLAGWTERLRSSLRSYQSLRQAEIVVSAEAGNRTQDAIARMRLGGWRTWGGGAAAVAGVRCRRARAW